MSCFRSIDPAELPKHFDAPGAEKRWDREWQRRGTYLSFVAFPLVMTTVAYSQSFFADPVATFAHSYQNLSHISRTAAN